MGNALSSNVEVLLSDTWECCIRRIEEPCCVRSTSSGSKQPPISRFRRSQSDPEIWRFVDAIDDTESDSDMPWLIRRFSCPPGMFKTSLRIPHLMLPTPRFEPMPSLKRASVIFSQTAVKLDSEDRKFREEVSAIIDTNDLPTWLKQRTAIRFTMGLKHLPRSVALENLDLSLTSRMSYGINDSHQPWIADECFQKMSELWPIRAYGYTTVGYPIVWDRVTWIPCDVDERVKKFSAGGAKELLCQHTFRVAELIDRYLGSIGERRKSLLLSYVRILDLEHFSLHIFRLESIMATLRFFVSNVGMVYPGSMQRLYIINAPWVFSACWKMISAWLHPATRAKIEILGTNYLQVIMSEGIPLESIPLEYGGTGPSFDDLPMFPRNIDIIPDLNQNHFYEDAVPASERHSLARTHAILGLPRQLSRSSPDT